MKNEHGLSAPQWAWEVQGVSPTEKLVLLALASFQITHDGMTSPSKAELARRCCIKSTRTVDAAVNALEAKGLIRRFVRRDEQSVHHTNIYQLMMAGDS